ncbi:MAG TPA: ferrous iron transport protein A [Peptococcaceae bacterium]|nr:ferrous iron transport protein A [Peptococcaceae bacterium]
MVPLSKLPVGARCKVVAVEVGEPERLRLLGLGLVPGTKVEVVRKSPCGDPIAYKIRGAVVALRQETARQVLVVPDDSE